MGDALSAFFAQYSSRHKPHALACVSPSIGLKFTTALHPLAGSEVWAHLRDQCEVMKICLHVTFSILHRLLQVSPEAQCILGASANVVQTHGQIYSIKLLSLDFTSKAEELQHVTTSHRNTNIDYCSDSACYPYNFKRWTATIPWRMGSHSSPFHSTMSEGEMTCRSVYMLLCRWALLP